MKIEKVLTSCKDLQKTQDCANYLISNEISRIKVNGLSGSSRPLFAAACASLTKQLHVFVLPDKESAAFFYGDLEQIFQEEDPDFSQKQAVFFPELSSSQEGKSNNFDALLRTKTLQRIKENERLLIVTYPEAVMQKVIMKETIEKQTFTIHRGEKLSTDFILEFLSDNNFEYSDFVFQPGQFSIRGGIVDVFSYANEHPYRIEFYEDMVSSLRTFEIETQLSKSILEKIIITPDIQSKENNILKVNLFDILPADTVLWFEDLGWNIDTIQKKYNLLQESLQSAFNH
jgi:transcription-repair coupling factor (superfamily II helicase)